MSFIAALVILLVFVVAFWAVYTYVTHQVLRLVLMAFLGIMFLLWIANLTGMSQMMSGKVG